MELYEILDDKVVSTRFSDQGAFNTQSSDDRYVRFVLENIPISEKEVFVDVGCGVGKVLVMLHNHCKLRIIGIEIDPIIAEIARDRVKGMGNIQVIIGNILDFKNVIQDASIFYLYNPFNAEVLDKFLGLVNSIGRKHVHVIYVNDIFKQVFEKHHFELISCKQFARMDKSDLEISIWAKSFNNI